MAIEGQWQKQRDGAVTHTVTWEAGPRGGVCCLLLSTAAVSVPRYTVLRLMIRQRLEEIAEAPETI